MKEEIIQFAYKKLKKDLNGSVDQEGFYNILN